MTNYRAAQEDTKIEDLCRRLRNLALQKGPGERLPTVETLCEQFKTTRVTLQVALNILEAERIVYRKRRLGIFVSPEIHHKAIHILFDSSSFSTPVASPFWGMLLWQLEQEAQRRATFKHEICTFHLIKPQTSPEDPTYAVPARTLHQLQAERVAGVLSVGIYTKDKERLFADTLPCVTFAAGGHWVVQYDGKTIARIAAQELLRQGCKRLGFWQANLSYIDVILQRDSQGNPEEYKEEQLEDYSHFCQVITENKLSIYPELLRQPHIPPTQYILTLQEQGYMLAREVFSGPQHTHPDGLFINDDMMTDGALIALQELNINVGQDLKLVTLANLGSPTLFGRTKNISLLEFDPLQVAQAMFSMLDMLMLGQHLDKDVTWIRPRLRSY